MASVSWQYHRGNQIVIPVVLMEPQDSGARHGKVETRYVIIDTGTNAGLVLTATDYDRFAWAHMKRATMRGAGSGTVRMGWGMVGVGPDMSVTARQVLISDGGERLRDLYDAAGERLGLTKGTIMGQAGMAFLDSFPAWSSRDEATPRFFSLTP